MTEIKTYDGTSVTVEDNHYAKLLDGGCEVTQLEQIPTLTSTDVLRAAARLIEGRGHCKKALTKDDGSLCLIGALRAATGHSMDEDVPSEDHTFWQAYRRVQRHIGTPLIAGWNDRRTTTKSRVIKTLRKA